MTYQSVDNQHGSGDIVVLALSDNIPSLAVGRSAFGHLNWSQVGAEVARELVDKKALPVRGLYDRSTLVSSLTERGPDQCRRPWRCLTFIAVFEKARVAVSSRLCASSKAAWLSSVTALGEETGPAATRVDMTAKAAEYLATILIRL